MYLIDMFVHERYIGRLERNAVDNFGQRLGDLPKGFNRTLLPMRELFAHLMRLDGMDVREDPIYLRSLYVRPDTVIKAEIIVAPVNVYIVAVYDYKTPSERAREAHLGEKGTRSGYTMNVHSVGPYIESDECKQLIEVLNKNFSAKLKKAEYRTARIEELKAEGRVSPEMPSEEDIDASKVLSDRATRTLAIAIKKSSGLLVGDLEKQLSAADRARTPEIRSSLESAGLVATETVVICTKSGAQVVKVPTLSTLQAFANNGGRCACGLAITDEKVETALSISERGRALLDGSRWFTVLLIRDFISLGVPLDQLLIDQVSGGDEMDCIAAIDGEIALFELKDKEFSLGNAYSFGAKIGFMNPDYSIIITTEHVGRDAKDHFSKTQQVRQRGRFSSGRSVPENSVIYIEGVSKLRSGLMSLIGSIGLGHVGQILDNVLPLGNVSPSVVLKHLDGRFSETDPLAANPTDGQSSKIANEDRQDEVLT